MPQGSARHGFLLFVTPVISQCLLCAVILLQITAGVVATMVPNADALRSELVPEVGWVFSLALGGVTVGGSVIDG